MRRKKDTGDYQLDSKIGIEGIEAALEDKLVGHRGEQLVEVTPNGTIVSETEKTPATSGNTVYLTIDARLQKIALDALKENVEAAQKEESYGSQCTGSVVVLDVNDFSVLCAQSYPNYDLDKYMNDPQYRERPAAEQGRSERHVEPVLLAGLPDRLGYEAGGGAGGASGGRDRHLHPVPVRVYLL